MQNYATQLYNALRNHKNLLLRDSVMVNIPETWQTLRTPSITESFHLVRNGGYLFIKWLFYLTGAQFLVWR